MSISLFEHNLDAYNAAVSMLNDTGKACIIHPTGTGKSFIGFKLAEDNPDKVVCWLSPSEYIFKTQLENLATTGAKVPENISFYTYAKLMLMSEQELAEIKPNYIIFDEFHRCGAEMWGQGVRNLLALYSDAPVLGLSATNIRYLDNQRDMADELFDGNVASEMTLGEAIVRGILNAPKYVLSIFSYQQQLKTYEKRIRHTRNKAIRDPAEKYLDALRRALDKADGIDEIFHKHMTARTGKYIVFCANYEHMQEMIEKAPVWFAKVDSEPRIYSVYSSDSDANQSFQEFKEDTDATHLRLLYCIDALNEGVHVEGISGVILLRPTVSPVIFKQQIGRALSASKQTDAVIFDIVLNIENLYSIGAVEEEMQIATSYYRFFGEESTIVNEHFRVIDEVRDCMELFEKLNDTLTASWEIMYEHARNYYLENGDLEIPARYITADGYSLGHWIYNQRSSRKGLQEGKLTEDRIEKLNSIGMRWDLYTDMSWERNFGAAQQYSDEHGNLDVYSRYVTEDGISLGLWLCSLRTWERAGAHPKYLTDERKAQLEAIGMIWDKLDFFWEQNYTEAYSYFREHRNLDIPSNYISKNGIRLGSWIQRQRQLKDGKCKGTILSAEQVSRLDQIQMIWKPKIDHKFDSAYQAAAEYYAANGNLLVPVLYVTEDGIKLGSWIQRQRLGYKRGKLSPARKKKLDEIGMVWDTEPWMTRYNTLLNYYHEHRTLDISQSLVVDGVWIGKWVVAQKKLYDKVGLTEKQRELLEKLPINQISQMSHQDKAWFAVYADAVDYLKERGALTDIPASYAGKSGSRLAGWIIRQRSKYNSGALSEEQIRLLNEIGIVWKLESAWEEGHQHAKAFYEDNGHLSMPSAYTCNDGYALGRWVYSQRNLLHANGARSEQLTDERIAALDKIGMEWNVDSRWDKSYKKAREYFYAHNGTLPKNIKSSDLEEKLIATWLKSQKVCFQQNRLTQEHQGKLRELHVDWMSPAISPFDKGYANAKAYFEGHEDLRVSTNYQCENGFWLGSWIDKQREKKNQLSDEQVALLDSICMIWEKDDPFEIRFAIAEQYFKQHGNLPLEPKQCTNDDELHICQWLRRQLLKRNDGKLSGKQITRLTSIGMDWRNTVEKSWQRGITHAQAYHKQFGNLQVAAGYVCVDGYHLGEWLHSQRKCRTRLSKDKVIALKQIGAVGFD